MIMFVEAKLLNFIVKATNRMRFFGNIREKEGY